MPYVFVDTKLDLKGNPPNDRVLDRSLSKKSPLLDLVRSTKLYFRKSRHGHAMVRRISTKGKKNI